MHNHENAESRAVWHALFISVMLHGVILFWYTRHQSSPATLLPDRLAVELLAVTSQALPQPETRPPAAPAQVVEPSMQKPVQAKQQAVLTDRQVSHTAEQVLAEPISKLTEPIQSESVQSVEKSVPTVSESNVRDSAETKSLAESAAVAASVKQEAVNKVSDNEELLSDDDAWQGYGQALYALVSKSKKYPAIAVRRHWEGDARILARFVRGELVEVQVLDASGHVPLDDEAVRMVKQAIAQLGMRDSLARKSFKVTIPVSFKLE